MPMQASEIKDLILELKSILIETYKERGDGNNYNRILNYYLVQIHLYLL